MSERDDGGSAFPEVVTDIRGEKGDYYQDTHSEGGMSLRDYFAAKAMQGMLSSDWAANSACAKDAYDMADAMLKARQA